MIYQCKSCPKKGTQLEIVKTTDNEPICLDCYGRTTSELRKGLVSLEEVLTIKKEFQSLQGTFKLTMGIFKRYSMKHGITNAKLFGMLDEVIPEVALEHFNKLPTAINIMDEMACVDIIFKNSEKLLEIKHSDLLNVEKGINVDEDFYRSLNKRYNII